MAWIEVQQSLIRHPKTKKAARLLAIPRMQVVGHVVALWAWALDYAPDGDVSRFSDDELADGAEWEDDPTRFRQALTTAGFLLNGCIKDWMDYSGGKLASLEHKREGNRKRQHEWRERNALVTRDGNALSRVSHGHTGPDRTEPDQPTPSPPPVTMRSLNGHAHCAYAAAVGEEKFSRNAAIFTALNKTLDRTWLRETLMRFEAQGLGLSPPQMVSVFEDAFGKVEEAFTRPNQINNPRAFAAKEIERALQEQQERTTA